MPPTQEYKLNVGNNLYIYIYIFHHSISCALYILSTQ